MEKSLNTYIYKSYVDYQNLYTHRYAKYKILKRLKFIAILLLVLILHLGLFMLAKQRYQLIQKEAQQHLISQDLSAHNNTMQIDLLAAEPQKKISILKKNQPKPAFVASKKIIENKSNNNNITQAQYSYTYKNKHIKPITTNTTNTTKLISNKINNNQKKEDVITEAKSKTTTITTSTNTGNASNNNTHVNVNNTVQNNQKIIEQSTSELAEKKEEKIVQSNHTQNQPAEYLGEKPPYPEFAIENGIEGSVLVKCLVDKNGYIKEMMVEKSSGEVVLDKAAIAYYLKNNKVYFKPAIKNDIAVESWKIFRVKFAFN
jgi:TonB family protein